MATLTLTRAWVNLLSTGEGITAWSADWSPTVYSVAGEVATYAGGRQRSVSTQGESGTVGCTLVLVSAATILTLREWADQPVQIRDFRGRAMIGVYYEVAEIPHKEPAFYDAAITLYFIDVPQGV